MIYIILALLLYTATILIGTSASRNANTNVASFIMTAVSAIVPLAIAFPAISKKAFTNHRFGIIMSILTGVCIALFTVTINKSYSLNKVGIVAPVVFGGAIVLSTLLSTVFFKEKLTALEAAGLLVITVGFSVLIYARAIAK